MPDKHSRSFRLAYAIILLLAWSTISSTPGETLPLKHFTTSERQRGESAGDESTSAACVPAAKHAGRVRTVAPLFFDDRYGGFVINLRGHEPLTQNASPDSQFPAAGSALQRSKAVC